MFREQGWVTVKSHFHEVVGISEWLSDAHDTSHCSMPFHNVLKADGNLASWHKPVQFIQVKSVYVGLSGRNSLWNWFDIIKDGSPECFADSCILTHKHFFSPDKQWVSFQSCYAKIRESNIGYVMTCYQHDYTRHGLAKTDVYVCFGIKFKKKKFIWKFSLSQLIETIIVWSSKCKVNCVKYI